MSLEEYKSSIIQKIKDNNQNPQITDETKPSTTLSKFSAYRLTYNRQDEQCKFKVLEIGTVSNGKAYFITYSAEEKAYNKYLALAETMINSFVINNQ
ncbi:MAG: photosystem II reaction center PsbP family protein [Goleter apudmare HA4340-LM2]|nr:photosystem II reaction center PsbP family protein [Goleter apudmare HA4340-LM2]